MVTKCANLHRRPFTQGIIVLVVLAGLLVPASAGSASPPTPRLVQEAKLTGSVVVWLGGEHFGSSVALSADGQTALIGVPGDNPTGIAGQTYGAAYIFTRSGTSWTQQAKLTNSEGNWNGGFGAAVALSGDGQTAFIGEPAYDGDGKGFGFGAVFVFTRSGTTWTQQAKLTPSGNIGRGNFGAAVALSPDGQSALIGAWRDNPVPNGYLDPIGIGAAYVFTRSGTTWTQQAKLTGRGEIGAGEFGTSVALSADGQTALIGGVSDDNQSGAAYVFNRSGGEWAQRARLTGSGEIGQGGFGSAVALTGDGQSALVGAPADNGHIGVTYAFGRSGTKWAQRARLTASGESGEGWFGAPIALSTNGRTALIGASYDNVVGAAYLFSLSFSRRGAPWTQQGKVIASGESGDGGFGRAVALSANGQTVLIGAPYDNGAAPGAGAAFAFGRP